jgi:hypothetical protein
MGSPERDVERIDAESEELREVVPERAVLTELARGFLLEQHSNPDRAVRFLATFLREQAHPPEHGRSSVTGPAALSKLPVRGLDRGVVDPSRGLR